MKNDANRIDDLEREINLLPTGGVTKKNIKGKDYYYHRFMQNGKRKEVYIPFEEVEELQSLILQRKELEKELKKLKRKSPFRKVDGHLSLNPVSYATNVRIGNQLKRFAEGVKGYRHRYCFSQLKDYVFGNNIDKVFVLYGLRRTGKTTMIRQIFLEMNSEQLEKTAFIQVSYNTTLSELNQDLNKLEASGYQYIFIDEVTLIAEFTEGAALFSDIYASSGMKIVLSGTDSLGFVFASHEQLYDRCVMLHTTFISYKEFEMVLGISGIDNYISYGGTMSMGGVDYNENSSFASLQKTNEYVDSAIARNVQHSLKYYQDGGHFRGLFDLYEKNELTSAINRVVEDMNHRFTKNVLLKTFKSNDLGISKRNLLRDGYVLSAMVNENLVNEAIKTMLEILDVHEQSICVDEHHAYQIKEYLSLLDLIVDIDLLYLTSDIQKTLITTISQPGLRYAQAQALIDSLMRDSKFSTLSIVQKRDIIQRILSEIKGRMLEEIVLLETKIACAKKHVFKLQFAVGEFDMVIQDQEHLTCELYEIKYNDSIHSNQYRHLKDEQKCLQVEHHFGIIISKNVIYRGDNKNVDGISYINVEEYLKSLY